MSAVASDPPATARLQRPALFAAGLLVDHAEREQAVPPPAGHSRSSPTARWLADPQVAALKRAIALPSRRYRIWLDPNGMDPAWAEALADDLDLPLGQDGELASGQATERSPLRFSARRHLARALSVPRLRPLRRRDRGLGRRGRRMAPDRPSADPAPHDRQTER